MAATDIDPDNPRYIGPLLDTARSLGDALGPAGRVILLRGVREGKELDYILAGGAERRGRRPPRLG